MEILWAGVAICMMVAVVLYALANSWQQLLRKHSRAIRILFQRMEALENMEDPQMRRKIGELTPSPLEQVHIFSFRLGERFWREVLGATTEQLRHVHDNGTFIGSVKIEVWRSHVAIELRELLPQSRLAGWQTRKIDLYTNDSRARAVLWEICLEPDADSNGAAPASVELRYEAESIVLAARNSERAGRMDVHDGESSRESIVFRIPLDGEKLSAFRVEDAGTEIDGIGEEQDTRPFAAKSQRADARVASFSHQDERQGVDWQLCIRDLSGGTASERWMTLEPWQTRRVS